MDPSDDSGTASVVLAWEKLERRVELARCGGGHVFHVRGSAVTTVLAPFTIGELARAAGLEPPLPRHATALASMLGVPSSEVALASIEWEPDDQIVLLSLSAGLPTEDLRGIVHAQLAGDDSPSARSTCGELYTVKQALLAAGFEDVVVVDPDSLPVTPVF